MRKTLFWAMAGAIYALAAPPLAVHAGTYDLTVDRVTIDTGDFRRQGIGYNGASPGPVLRFSEGEDVTINVTNNLDVATSVHWHGLILPFQMDGVPAISYPGIAPGETFTYSFPIRQAGTYWFHSHSGLQEPNGAYGAIVIKPKGREPFRYDRDYVVQLTDAHPHTPARILRNLKLMPDYYNRKQRTAADFFADVSKKGLSATLGDRGDWGEMRMMPTDIEDVQGFTALINGKGPAQNWTGLFKPGERVRLRFINSSAMTYFDIRIPGLDMIVVQADGNNVRPVKVSEFRIAVAETYDVIVRPIEDQAYTIFAASMGRSSYARATLAPREGLAAEVPELSGRPLLTMADMGMAHQGMDHAAMAPKGMKEGAMGGKPMDHAAMGQAMADKPADKGAMDGASGKPMDHAAMGHTPAAGGMKKLNYSDLQALEPNRDVRAPTRDVALRLTGDMERYFWTLNDKKLSQSDPIRLTVGERVRLLMTNETMMEHPMHLHGVFMELQNGGPAAFAPRKHTISVPPNETVEAHLTFEEPGAWAFHCHLLYHMMTGMFVRVEVAPRPATEGV